MPNPSKSDPVTEQAVNGTVLADLPLKALQDTSTLEFIKIAQLGGPPLSQIN